MKLPINFPDDSDVIAEEASRFRALSPENRIRSIRGMIATGAIMMARSSKAEFLREYTQDQEDRARRSIREFWARHAR